MRTNYMMTADEVAAELGISTGQIRAGGRA